MASTSSPPSALTPEAQTPTRKRNRAQPSPSHGDIAKYLAITRAQKKQELNECYRWIVDEVPINTNEPGAHEFALDGIELLRNYLPKRTQGDLESFVLSALQAVGAQNHYIKILTASNNQLILKTATLEEKLKEAHQARREEDVKNQATIEALKAFSPELEATKAIVARQQVDMATQPCSTNELKRSTEVGEEPGRRPTRKRIRRVCGYDTESDSEPEPEPEGGRDKKADKPPPMKRRRTLIPPRN